MDLNTKDDAATKHVLDYYKKYSQNKELTKYFSGTALSYLPEINNARSPETEVKTLVNTDINIVITTEEPQEEPENVGEPVSTSRASSAMSNHKLEWDNGADIGYDNCQRKRLQKSVSLPIMDDMKHQMHVTDFELAKCKEIGTRTLSNSDSSDGDVKVVLLTSSSSSEVYSDQNKKKELTSSSTSNAIDVKGHTESISSSGSSNAHSLKQFASTLSYLKQKIGLPGAHSTPKFMDQKNVNDICSDTPLRKKSPDICKSNASASKSADSLVQVGSKGDGKTLMRKPSVLTLTHASADNGKVSLKKNKFYSSCVTQSIVKYRNNKIINLAVTEPITVECMCSNQSLTVKSLQTATKRSTVAVQTDELIAQKASETIQNPLKNYNNQSLIYFDYSDSEKTKCTTQTSSEAAESQCNSFEFLKEKSPQISSNASRSGAESEVAEASKGYPVIGEHATNLRKTEKNSDLRQSPREEVPENSSEYNLGSNLLNTVEDDIGKSIYVLQRLVKSKKYDSGTKKKYIKRIIRKIMESKFLEESSTSSDLFIPKKVQKADSSGDKNEQHPLQSNVPWYPVTAEQFKSSPRKRLVQKTFAQDFLPEQLSSKEEFSSAQEIVPVNSRDMRKNRFTLTNNEFSVNQAPEKGFEKSQSNKTSFETDSTSLEKQYESSSTSKSYQNWRDDKTLSERLFEKQSEEKSHTSNGNGDGLMKFADKERQFQISWINNEISHLGKLKGLLEKPKSAHSKRKNPLHIKKTTNVYTVSNENDIVSERKRNYVIETLLGTHHSADINFKLDGQVYTVHEFLNSKGKQPKKPRQVTGNIEVVSSDSTTNIKVSTFCEECKRSPCICDLLDHEGDCTCQLSENCEYCGSKTCICQSRALAKATSASLPKKTKANNDCTGATCSCVSSSLSSERNDVKVCCTCNKYPCLCEVYKDLPKSDVSNDRITGTFIPVTGPRPMSVKFSTFPSTSKEDSERAMFLPSTDVPVDTVEKSTSASSKTVPLLIDHTSSDDSLKRVFENCACTQTDCTCDFVEKLINRFSKTDQPSAPVCDNKCSQTEKSKDTNVALQAHFDNQHEIQQTTLLNVDDKSLQTDTYETESQTVGIQTKVDTVNQNEQTIMHNFQNIGIQAVMDVKDEILQTSRSIEGVTTHISTNGEQKKQNATTSPIIHSVDSVDTTLENIINQKDTMTSSKAYTVGKTIGNVTKEKDTKASSMIHSVGTTIDNTIKHQDAATSPIILKPDRVKNQKDTMVAQTVHSIGTSSNQFDKQQIVTNSEKTATKITHTDSSRPTSSSKSSTSDRHKRKVLCLCCCTQTDPKYIGKSREKHARVQTERNDADSDKENVRKQKGDSLTTSSTTYEICPSILVSSYNDTSQSISEGSSSKSTLIVCVCCNEKYSADKMSILGSKNENFPLCCNCLAQRPILTSVCYAGPEENCPCSKPSSRESAKRNISDETKKTATDSNDIDDYCTCTKPFQFKNSKYCSYCRYKLRNTARSKNGIAYTLTLEADCLNKIRRRRKKTPLEEIKLKVPSPSHKKKHKDKENVSKRENDKDRKCVCDGEHVICTSNCHVKGISSKHKKDDKKDGLTLQEWLKKNRPDFIESAETRRQVVLDSKTERQAVDVDAKLKFAEDNKKKMAIKKPKKLFTEQQMKAITKKRYKKLPEVKEKIHNQREQRLRSADRFIMDVFARKIQHSVLKGKSSFPIDSNVICLPKNCNC